MKSVEKLVFFGNDDFSLPSLQLLNEKYTIGLVITKPDRPTGRKKILTPNPVKQYCIENHIPLHETNRLRDDNEVIHLIKRTEALFGVVVSFGSIITKQIIDIFPFGIINIHPSLLPTYRGPSPLQMALLNGDTVSGISIMLIDEALDHGPILYQESVDLSQFKNYGIVHKYCAEHGSRLLISTLEKYLNGSIKPLIQNDSKSTITKTIKKEDGILDLSKDLIYTIHCKVRAFTPWPSCRVFVQNKEFKLLETDYQDTIPCEENDVLIEKNKKLYIKGADKKALRIILIQPANKDPMSDSAFLNGYAKYVAKDK